MTHLLHLLLVAQDQGSGPDVPVTWQHPGSTKSDPGCDRPRRGCPSCAWDKSASRGLGRWGSDIFKISEIWNLDGIYCWIDYKICELWRIMKNYDNSVIWNHVVFGLLPLVTIIPVRSQWDLYKSSRSMVDTWVICWNIAVSNMR